ILRRVGHGELLLLFGVCIAIGGFELFELLNLKGGLGALVFGLLLGNTAKSQELYKNLIQLKDLYLIGFFLLIGYYGLPSAEMWIMAALLCLVLPLRPVIYHALLVAFKVRARTAFLTGMSLFNYSEFGLIVASIATEAGLLPPEWLTTIALAMALSFFIATPLNTRIHKLFRRFFLWTQRFERQERLPIERFPDLGRSDVAVLGMGRVGLGAYNFLKQNLSDSIVGIEENDEKARLHRDNGINCDHGDASDQALWMHSGLNRCKKIFVCLSNHRENLYVVDLAREAGFKGVLAVVSRFPDEERELKELGCITFNLYAEAGHGFAEHVMNQIEKPVSP
ncbi:MAG: NAD-binding protein, partial [bacterium]